MKIMHKTDRCQNTRRHVGVRLCFRDVYFLRMQITERFNPLDFGFAYGHRSFSCKAVVISFSKSHIKLKGDREGIPHTHPIP